MLLTRPESGLRLLFVRIDRNVKVYRFSMTKRYGSLTEERVPVPTDLSIRHDTYQQRAEDHIPYCHPQYEDRSIYGPYIATWIQSFWAPLIGP
jgi:hypothetical protein